MQSIVAPIKIVSLLFITLTQYSLRFKICTVYHLYLSTQDCHIPMSYAISQIINTQHKYTKSTLMNPNEK